MINVVLIGYGYWGKILANQLNKTKNINFIGIIEKNKKSIIVFKKKFPNKKAYSNLDDFLKFEKKVDAAIVATNFKYLYQTTNTLLKKGIHCLVEKPVSKSLVEINKLSKIAKLKSLICMPGYIFLHNDAIRYIKKILIKKLLGNLRIITFERTNLGPIREDLNSIWDLASHDISILNYLVGKNVKIKNTFSKSFLKKNVSDYAVVNFAINEKIFGFIHCSWLNPKKERKITIVGDKKMLVWNDMNIAKPITIYDKGVYKKEVKVENFKQYKNYLYSGKEFSPVIRSKTPLENEILSFFRAIKGINKNYIDMSFAATVTKILKKI